MYSRTLAAEDVVRVHREISPANILEQGQLEVAKDRKRGRKPRRSRLIAAIGDIDPPTT